MLLLWDHVIERHADALGRLDPAERCGLAVDVVESTESLFSPPFAEFFPSVAADLIQSTVARVRESASEWRLGRGRVEEFFWYL